MPRSNRFDKIFDQTVKKRRQQSLELEHSRLYCLKISLNGDGNEPTEFFDRRDSSLMREFINFMKKHKWAGSDKLVLERPKLKHPLSTSEMRIGSWSHNRFKRLVKLPHWHVAWSGQGYRLGVISRGLSPFISESAILFLCSDGKLRVMRSEPVFPDKWSLASGVGTIPDFKHIQSGLKVTTGWFVDTSADGSKIPYFEKHSLENLLSKYVEIVIVNNLQN